MKGDIPKIEPKFYRALIAGIGPIDFDGMPGTTTKNWGDSKVQGYEGKLVQVKGQPEQWAFVPFHQITAWTEVRQAEVNDGTPRLHLPSGGA